MDCVPPCVLYVLRVEGWSHHYLIIVHVYPNPDEVDVSSAKEAMRLLVASLLLGIAFGHWRLGLGSGIVPEE